MQKKQITLASGETLAYIEQGQGNRTVIMIHGNMSSSLHYLPLYTRFPNNVRVLALDLRGFGDSTYNAPIETLRDYADEVFMFMQALNVEKADIIGWSTGGGIALEFAAKYPHHTNKMVLIESASHKGYPIFKKNAQNQVKLGEPYASKAEMALDPVQVLPVLNALKDKNAAFMSWLWDISIYTVKKPTKEENDLYIAESLKQRNLVDIDWALAVQNMSDTPNFYRPGAGTIHHITASILHIWSKKDIVIPEFMAYDNYQALSDQSKMLVYEDSGHSPLVDVQDTLANDILDFLEINV